MKRQDFFSEITSQIAALESKYGLYQEFCDRANWFILVNEEDWVTIRKDFFIVEHSFVLDKFNEWYFLGIKVVSTINKMNPTLVVELNKIKQ